MFSLIPIKQEYSGVEEENTGPNGLQSHPEYPLFTHQDVEYMYRQLPQFWNQSQLQSASNSADSSKNSPQVHQNVSQTHPERPVTSTSFMQEGVFHGQNDGKSRDSQCLPENSQLMLNPMIQQQQVALNHSFPLIRTPVVPVKQTGPGRPPKTSESSPVKKLKCQCEICFKEFGHKSNLFIHMRTHNGERPYKCSQCDKCFTHSGNLAIHMRTHSGERPYACQICGKMFSHSGNLSTHLRTHSGVKPYKCNICGKEFRHSGNLSIHERIHSGIKPFQCKVCGKEFYHSGNLTTHMKKHPLSGNNVEESIEVDQQQILEQRIDIGDDPIRLDTSVGSSPSCPTIQVTNPPSMSSSSSDSVQDERDDGKSCSFVPPTS
ncbi:zinc finger protein 2-like [Chelonus insularis]|uniref:zinc finger protein 2-like n=1 Tax=Chelonus insularis TaxID=460826 RepID=UPI0015889C60|nr:zinc finger protein 2-like [Chelonus insularis]